MSSAAFLEPYPRVRYFLYAVQWLTALVSGMGGIFFAASTEGVPDWYVIANSMLAFLWTYTGVTAASNVGVKGTHREPLPPGPGE